METENEQKFSVLKMHAMEKNKTGSGAINAGAREWFDFK